MKKIVYGLLILIIAGSFLSCNKRKFLDEKPNSDLFVPTTLKDFQLLLENEPELSQTPALGEISADNYYLVNSLWQRINRYEYNSCIWADNIFQGQGNIGDWNLPYAQVFYANVVLAGLEKVAITTDNEQQWKKIKGSALFIRSFAFFNLAQVFAPVYNEATAESDLGIPIRLSPNVDLVTTRASVKQTYEQILNDLKEASGLLPGEFPKVNKNHPSKLAAYSLLARVYLSMRIYDSAWYYANSSLQLYDTLIDYNLSDPGSNLPFKNQNAEVLYQGKIHIANNLIKGVIVQDCIVDSNLFNLYSANDLRKSLFFKTHSTSGLPNLKGSYTGTIFSFGGLANDENYLIRAECYARNSNETEAIKDLNTLLLKRWKTGTFVPYAATNASEALQQILEERRKELCFRGLRWTDLRRLNKEGYNITLKRKIEGFEYTLSPNHSRYTLPIPPDVINLSGIPQNPR